MGFWVRGPVRSFIPAFAIVFLLVFQEDFTCREAAELLNIPLGTVLSRIHRARQFMRRILRQLDPTDEPEVVAPHTPNKRNGEQ